MTAVAVDWTVHVTEDGTLVDRCWASVRDGLMPWSALDDDEIAKGALRARDGAFRAGGHPVPPDLHRALVQEHIRRINERMRADLDAHVGVIKNVADGSVFGATAADQLKAAIYLMERVVGKVPDKVEVTATIKPWEELVEGIIVDAEVVEETVEGPPLAGSQETGPLAVDGA